MNVAPTLTLQVHVAMGAETLRAGTAFLVTRRGILTTTFEYETDYLRHAQAWSLGPDLPLTAGSTTTAALPGALADSAPDRWGRNLIRRTRQSDAREAGQRAPTTSEADYLLGVSDFTRQGCLRFRIVDGPFLAESADVPSLLELPRLLNAADLVTRDNDSVDAMTAVKTLLNAGTGTLGGARPKASVRDGERLLIAKFPHHNDDWDVMAWEKTALDLAALCGIEVPPCRLVPVAGKHVLLVQRFDRDGDQRLGYISGMSILMSHDGDHRDYLDLSEAITKFGSNVNRDLEQLWRRIALSVVLNNTDDHLRNHGFLRRDHGWALSPIFDVNPNPDLGEDRNTGINGETHSHNAELALMEAAPFFRLDDNRAKSIWSDVREACWGWRDVAKKNGIGEGEVQRFADALDRHTR